MLFQMKTIESVPDGEAAVMQAILHLSCSEGIILPECSMDTAATGAESVISLHGVIDSQEHAVTAAWNQLCLQLRHRVLQRLERLPDGNPDSCRYHLLSGLQLLFPSSHIAALYRSIRQRQLESCIEQQLHSSGGLRKQSFVSFVPKFSDFMSKVAAMMRDDFELCIAGTFEGIDFENSFDYLGEIYFDRLQDEVEAAADKLLRFVNYCKLFIRRFHNFLKQRLC